MSRQNDIKEDCPPSGGHQLRGRETLGESYLLHWQNPVWNGMGVDKVKGFRLLNLSCVGHLPLLLSPAFHLKCDAEFLVSTGLNPGEDGSNSVASAYGRRLSPIRVADEWYRFLEPAGLLFSLLVLASWHFRLTQVLQASSEPPQALLLNR